MKRLIPLLVLLVSISQAQAWTVTANFENGTVGKIATGNDALTNNAGQATFSDIRAQSGSQSLRAEVQAGGTAYGGRIAYPSNLVEGDEVWFRAYWFYPSNWSFKTNAVGLKTMRIHTETAAKANTGYHDIYIADADQKVRPHSEIFTSAFNNVIYSGSSSGTYGQVVPKGQWHCFEIYVKFSSVPGKGAYRIWQNGNLVFEDTSLATLRSSTDHSNFALIGNYFNGSAPQTQSAFVDNIVLTSSRPSNTDAHGNPMVGLSDKPIIAPPNPPGSIAVEIKP